jgi:cytochrome c
LYSDLIFDRHSLKVTHQQGAVNMNRIMSNVTVVRNAEAVAEREALEGSINISTPDGVFRDNSMHVANRGGAVVDAVCNHGTALSSKRTPVMVAALVAILAEPAAAQDATRGVNVFKQCMICHAVGPGAQNKIGPDLNGLDGRQSGSLTTFSYSAANRNSSFVWNEATFKQYIANPQAMIPGTKMPFAGLKDPQQISDLWAYLKQFNADGTVKH